HLIEVVEDVREAVDHRVHEDVHRDERENGHDEQMPVVVLVLHGASRCMAAYFFTVAAASPSFSVVAEIMSFSSRPSATIRLPTFNAVGSILLLPCVMRSRADRGIARRRIVRAIAVSTRPGCALALMPSDPIQMKITTMTINMIATSNPKALRTALMITSR